MGLIDIWIEEKTELWIEVEGYDGGVSWIEGTIVGWDPSRKAFDVKVDGKLRHLPYHQVKTISKVAPVKPTP